MNSNLNKIQTLLFILFSFLNTLSYSQINDTQKEAELIVAMLEKKHYNPRIIDDKLSQDIFYGFLEKLDPHGLYFTKADINKLSGYRNQIDNELKGSSWKFLPAVTLLYKEKLLSVQKLYTSILQNPFTYTSTETLSFSSKKDSINFAAGEIELNQRWTKYLKYEALAQLIKYDDLDAEVSKLKPADIKAKEIGVRQNLKKIHDRSISKILQHPSGFEKNVEDLFFNAIVSCYDAHCLYMSKTEWQNFESLVSTEEYSFGLDLDENDNGDIIIARLVPGGPAWKSNELHKGDAIIKLQWEGKEETDLIGAEVSEVEHMLQASNSGVLILTVRSMNGMNKSVNLTKEKIRADENIVKSFILKGEKKIGYITLPGFYSEWDLTGLGCANDVAKEIVKLQKENIEGLILDIRSNGGGAMIEGLNLAGIFIDEGPLFMVQPKQGKPMVMKDMNRGTVYDGPLVIMVNGQSASASELLASTLQDYNRAVIVGSNTFGKATAQQIMPIDTTIDYKTSESEKLKSPYGFASITVHKLYRITGKTAQLKGVKPDVYLPDINEKWSHRETSYPFVLSADSINKKVIYNPLPPLPLNELTNRSRERLNKDIEFKTIEKLSRKSDSLFVKMDNIPLTYESFRKRTKDLYKWWNEMENANETKSESYAVEYTNYDNEIMKADSYGKETGDYIINQLQSDIYLDETFRILSDLINLNKK